MQMIQEDQMEEQIGQQNNNHNKNSINNDNNNNNNILQQQNGIHSYQNQQKLQQQNQQQHINNLQNQQTKPNISIQDETPKNETNRIHSRNQSGKQQQNQQYCNTEGNEERRRQTRKHSNIIQAAQTTQMTDNSIDIIQPNSTKNTKQRIEYDVVKQYLVKAYTEQCEEEGQMELVQISTKRSITRKKRKKTPLLIEKAFKEQQNKKQINNVFDYTIIDNKKKRQEIKLKQRQIRDYNIHNVEQQNDIQLINSMDFNNNSINNNIHSHESIPINKHTKSQSLHTNSNTNYHNQQNNNNNNISPIKEVSDTIVVEDSYPLEWDPGFNKRARKQLDIINQSRSSNTLPLLDLSNVKTLEKYRHVLKCKQGWQPLLNTPFLPISPSNQLTKADLFKNLLKEQKQKLRKSKTPLKTNGSRLRGRLISLQNEWGKYNINNNNANSILDPDGLIIVDSNNNQNDESSIQFDKPQPTHISVNQHLINSQKNQSSLLQRNNLINPNDSNTQNESNQNGGQQYKSNNKRDSNEDKQQILNNQDIILNQNNQMINKNNRQINEQNKGIQNNMIPSKVIEVDEENLTSEMKQSSNKSNIQSYLQQTEFDNIDFMNQKFDKIIQKLTPKTNNPQQQQQPIVRDIKTANRLRPNIQNTSYTPTKIAARYNDLQSVDRSTLDQRKHYSNQHNFYQQNNYKSKKDIPIKPDVYFNDAESFGVSRSHEFYDFTVYNNNNNNNMNSSSNINNNNNSYNTINNNQNSNSNISINRSSNNKLNNISISYSTIQQQQDQGKVTPSLEGVSTKQQQDTLQYQSLQNNNNKYKSIQSSDKHQQSHQMNDKNKTIYISYLDKKMLTDGSYEDTINADLQETIKVQEIMLQEQKLKQQLNFLRSQGERANKIDKTYNYSYIDQDLYKRNNNVNILKKQQQNLSSSTIDTHNNNQQHSTLPVYPNSNYNNIPKNHSVRQTQPLLSQTPYISQNQSNNITASRSPISIRQSNNISQNQYTISNNQNNNNNYNINNNQQTLKRLNSKSPMNKSVVIKDTLSPHQRIYVQQGKQSNHILLQKQSSMKNNSNGNMSYSDIKDYQPDQTFSSNFNNNILLNQTQNQFKFEQELTDQQEIQIAQLQQQFDDIIKSNHNVAKKNNNKLTRERKYVQQSII